MFRYGAVLVLFVLSACGGSGAPQHLEVPPPPDVECPSYCDPLSEEMPGTHLDLQREYLLLRSGYIDCQDRLARCVARSRAYDLLWDELEE